MTRRKRPAPPHAPALSELPAAPPDPYTVEGTIARLGDFADAANHRRGWRRWSAKTFVVVFLLAPLLAGTLSLGVMLVLDLVRALLGG